MRDRGGERGPWRPPVPAAAAAALAAKQVPPGAQSDWQVQEWVGKAGLALREAAAPPPRPRRGTIWSRQQRCPPAGMSLLR